MQFLRAAHIACFFAVLFFLSACSSSSNDSSSPTVGSDTASFDDDASAAQVGKTETPVTGMRFRDTKAQWWHTGDNGHFEFQAGTPISFYIGEISFLVEDPERILPLYKLVGENSYSGSRTQGLIRFLFSIDNDENPKNGVHVPSAAHYDSGISTLDIFDNEAELLAFVRSFKPSVRALLPTSKAMNLFWTSIGKSDADVDGVPDSEDNCPFDANFSQLDLNANAVGDVCEGEIPADPVIAEESSIALPSKTFGRVQLIANDANNTEVHYKITKNAENYEVNLLHNIALISAQKQCTGDDYFEYVGINEFGQFSEPTRVYIEEKCEPSEISDIYFPDQWLRNCVLTEAYDQNTSVIANIEHLRCQGLGIQTTEGLSHFKNLKTLDLSFNPISTLSLIDHPNVETLDLRQTQLSELDARKQANLNSLKVESPNLENLALPESIGLELLELGSPRLSDFSFSGLTQLKHLKLNDTALSNITLAADALKTLRLNNLEMDSLALTGAPTSTMLEIYINGGTLGSLSADPGLNISRLVIKETLLTEAVLPKADNIYLEHLHADSSAALSLASNLELDHLAILGNKDTPSPINTLDVSNAQPRALTLRDTKIETILSVPFSRLVYLNLSDNTLPTEDLSAQLSFDGAVTENEVAQALNNILISDSDYFSVYPLKTNPNANNWSTACPTPEEEQEEDLAPDCDQDGVPDADDIDVDGDKLIEVATLNELNDIRNSPRGTTQFNLSTGCPEGGCKGFELTADLDFDTNKDGVFTEHDAFYNQGKGWTPIANFSAIFDGNDHTISNLFVNSEFKYGGLFGATNIVANTKLQSNHDRPYTILRNTNFDGELLSIKAEVSGTLAGWINYALVENISVKGNKINILSGDFVGGIIGQAYNSTVRNIDIQDIKLRGKYVGGAMGMLEDSIIDSVSVDSTDISQDSDTHNSGSWPYIGGAIGSAINSDIRKVKANVTLKGPYLAGGIIGKVKTSLLLETESKGDMLATFNPDSIRGGIAADSSNTIYSKNISRIQIYESEVSGGLIGYSEENDYIYQSYTTSLIKAQIGGGLVGMFGIAPGVRASYWAKDSSRQLTASSQPLNNAMEHVKDMRGVMFSELGCPDFPTTYGCLAEAEFLPLFPQWDFYIIDSDGRQLTNSMWDFSGPLPLIQRNLLEASPQLGYRLY